MPRRSKPKSSGSAQEVAKDVTRPRNSKAAVTKIAAGEFSVLAALFAVAAEYDGDVRWKDAAAALRDVFARAGHNCKVGTDQTFQEATQRKQDLADLISGNRPKSPTPSERPIGARSPIGRRSCSD